MGLALDSPPNMMYIHHMAKSEVRTQIYLPGEIHRALKERARRDRKSMAEEVREAVTQYLTEPAAPADLKNDPILKLIGFARDKEGKTDVAENHDQYIYDAEYERWQREAREDRKRS